MRVLRYSADQIYSRPEVEKRLRFLTNGGWGRHKEGSTFAHHLWLQSPGTYFLAWENGEIVGWSIMLPNRKRAFTQFDGGYKVGCYVSPAYRRQGVGSQLILAAKKLAKARHKALWCCPWSRKSHAFFEKHGLRKLQWW